MGARCLLTVVLHRSGWLDDRDDPVVGRALEKVTPGSSIYRLKSSPFWGCALLAALVSSDGL
jgi:hypothetical protein